MRYHVLFNFGVMPSGVENTPNPYGYATRELAQAFIDAQPTPQHYKIVAMPEIE